MPEDDNGGTLELTQEQFTAAINQAVEAAREQDRGENERLQARLSQTESSLRERQIEESCRRYQEAGHAPATITTVRSILEAAQNPTAPILALALDDDTEAHLTVDDVVDQVLASIPATSLAATGLTLSKEDASKTGGAGGDKTAKERADEMWEDLKGGPAVDINLT